MTLLLGSSAPEVASLATALDATHVLLALPDPPPRTRGRMRPERVTISPEFGGGEAVRAVVVAMWTEAVAEPAGLATLSSEEWVARAEEPLARWFTALGVAARRCADGGAIVAVVERPAPLDCAGWAAEAGVADAVEAMVRSLARSEGGRGVRVNAVTTPTRLVPATVVDPAPSLPTFPGAVEDEVAGAVRLLLADDAAGVTGTVVHADCGRSWR